MDRNFYTEISTQKEHIFIFQEPQKKKMNPCSIQQSAFVSREEMRREAVVCPKPRRLNLLSATIHEHHPVRPFRWHFGYLSLSRSSGLLELVHKQSMFYKLFMVCCSLDLQEPSWTERSESRDWGFGDHPDKGTLFRAARQLIEFISVFNDLLHYMDLRSETADLKMEILVACSWPLVICCFKMSRKYRQDLPI